ncbi:MAG: hypothetical protein IIC24_00045, partial [Chloroflexi bacterium]|nr:hypothetical protein [Chloroflexota bacterium]
MTAERNRLIAVVLAVAVWTPTDGRALELGVTPSDVFGLWTNINTTILDYARLRSKTPEWDQRLAAMAPKKFTGKRPGDVLVEVEEVSRLVAVFGNHGD